MNAQRWYLRLKEVLPQQFARYMDREFSDWKTEATNNPEDFKNQVKDYIRENIGKSASDPLSIRVYAIMEDKSEFEVLQDFINKGCK